MCVIIFWGLAGWHKRASATNYIRTINLKFFTQFLNFKIDTELKVVHSVSNQSQKKLILLKNTFSSRVKGKSDRKL